jgi:hypothetical protein
MDSAHSTPTSSSGAPATYTYNIDRFSQQSAYANGTINARIPGNPSCPQPNARIPFYETRAASAIVEFAVAFDASSRN